ASGDVVPGVRGAARARVLPPESDSADHLVVRGFGALAPVADATPSADAGVLPRVTAPAAPDRRSLLRARGFARPGDARDTRAAALLMGGDCSRRDMGLSMTLDA